MNQSGQYPTWILLIPVACILAGALVLHLTRDRIRHAITVRRFRRDMERHLAAVARLEDEIAETRRRMRECTEGGDD